MVHKRFYTIQELAIIIGKTVASIHGHLSRKQYDAVPPPMRAKTEQDRQELEALTQQQFTALSESLRQSSTVALTTTEAAIQEKLGMLEASIASRCQTLSRAFGQRWLQALLLSMFNIPLEYGNTHFAD